MQFVVHLHEDFEHNYGFSSCLSPYTEGNSCSSSPCSRTRTSTSAAATLLSCLITQMSASNAAFCFKSSLSFYTNSRRTFSASALARFMLTADAIEDSLTSDNCSTNSGFFFLISELTFLKVSTHFVKLSIWSVRNF